MKPALRENQLQAPKHWQSFRQGSALAAALEQQLAPWWQQIFGYYLLKVGDLSCQLATPECRVRHQLRLGSGSITPDLVAEPDALPIACSSVDAVLLSHCLEFQNDPHHVIREAHRVLVADGYLLLSGFNPHSWLGLWRCLPAYQQQLPWLGHFFSAARIKDWLHLIGFEVIAEQRFFCSAMLAQEFRQNSWQKFNERFLGLFASSYLLVARKRELPLTPIRPKWRVQSGFTPAQQGIRARDTLQLAEQELPRQQ
jgi:SAM-dependent methyltransferase